MILTHDHSHDLLIWSQYMTYKIHPDIKSSSIPSSASSLPCHDYIRVLHLSYDYYIFTALQYASSTGPDSVVVAWEGFTSIAINESHWREPRRLLQDQRQTRIQWWWREGGLPRSLLMKAIGGSHKWSGEQDG